MDLTILSESTLQELKEWAGKELKFLAKLEREIQQEEWARHVAANESEVA